MKTVSSDRNLLIWKRNKNGSNIELPVLGGDEYYLRRNYAHLFRTVAETLKAKKVASFVRLWLDLVNSECSAIEKRIRESAKEFKPSKSAVELVVNKFRGNCGEILVETLAENGLLSNICKPGTYEPVDPDNEKFIDAEGVRNGMPVGIQIKNYDRYSQVKHETFIKAAAMDSVWIRQEKRAEDVVEFTSTPSQYIVSTSDTLDIYLEMYKDIVVFLGPKWFETLKIQGSLRTGESSKWRMFADAADEIEKSGA